jgi:hypothetical protein
MLTKFPFFLTITIVTLVVLIGVTIVIALFGRSHWRAETNQLLTNLKAVQVSVQPATYDSAELADLPEPVQRYFRTVLRDEAPLITAVDIEHAGTFNMGATKENWLPFTSRQRVMTQPAGFVWDARISMFPGFIAHVHDAFVAGRGVLEAKLFGLLTVMKMPSSPQLDEGELMRYLAEAPWYPTALLPSQGVIWQPVDDTQARATLTSRSTTVTLTFQFDERGLIKTVHSERRYREVKGVQVPTPWQGNHWDYQWYDKMLVPYRGEVAWMLPEGPKPYWRGQIQSIEYQYAE